MPGERGKITRAQGGERRAIYLSDKFGVWQEGDNLHFTSIKNQDLHASIKPADGLLYDVLLMLYHRGQRING